MLRSDRLDPCQSDAMATRFRPFGVFGSFVEVLVGAWMISGIVRDNEDYGVGFTATVIALGAILIGAGLIGFIAAARSKHQGSER